MFTGPVGPVEVFFYWPEAIFGNFYWPEAIGPLLASSPALTNILLGILDILITMILVVVSFYLIQIS